MKKRHQHFIPRTYLNRFAHTKKEGTYLVDVFNKITGKPVSDLSVADICVETDFYTLNHLENHGKFNIENFFSKNIEARYHEVYKILVKEKKKRITPQEKTLILYATLSMYFRTPKVLNQFANFSAIFVDRVKTNRETETIDFLGYKISIKGKSFDDIRKEIKETNRVNYLKTQLALLSEFVLFRAFDDLTVIELVGDQEFVTSDNPVEVRNSFGNRFSLFDSENAIYIPLDPKHALFIAPRQKEVIMYQVYYQRDNFLQHVILNYCVFENAERWIIGTKNGIERFIKDKEEFSKLPDKGLSIYTTFKNKLELLETLTMLAEKGISSDNLALIKFLKGLKKNELYNDNIELQDIYQKFKELGFPI